jgi:hypothetical protein
MDRQAASLEIDRKRPPNYLSGHGFRALVAMEGMKGVGIGLETVWLNSHCLTGFRLREDNRYGDDAIGGVIMGRFWTLDIKLILKSTQQIWFVYIEIHYRTRSISVRLPT